jgi:tetratricopeptide (TPR) repeat protein
MKKLTLLLLLIMPVIAFSQSAKLTNAINYYEDFSKNPKDQESLTKAKENIDIVSQNPEMKDPGKVLKFKGLIYEAIFENNLRLQTEKLTSITDPNQKALMAYQNTSIAELDIAAQAYDAIKAVDPKGIYSFDVMKGRERLYSHYFNKANTEFNLQKFDSSLQLFERAYDLDDTKDTNTLNNMGLAALNANKYEKARTVYSKMIELKVGGARAYSLFVQSCFELKNAKDTATGVDVLQKGRAIYPNDPNLINTETNYFLSHNKREEAKKNLNTVILARPQEPTLYLARGGLYDKEANPEDKDGKPLPTPANYNELMKTAEADYQKTVELCEPSYKNIASLNKEEKDQLRETYSKGLFNLGVVYFNQGAKIAKDADKITDNAKFAAENKKANASFNKAIPYLEKALEVKSDDQIVYALKKIYSRLELTDKLKDLNAKLKN